MCSLHFGCSRASGSCRRLAILPQRARHPGRYHLHCPPEHESMTIVIPIEEKRFYYNRKINCLPAEGSCTMGISRSTLAPRYLPGFAGLGAGRVGISQLLELGQRFGLPAGWAHRGAQPGLRLRRYLRRQRRLPDPGWARSTSWSR